MSDMAKLSERDALVVTTVTLRRRDLDALSRYQKALPGAPVSRSAAVRALIERYLEERSSAASNRAGRSSRQGDTTMQALRARHESVCAACGGTIGKDTFQIELSFDEAEDLGRPESRYRHKPPCPPPSMEAVIAEVEQELEDADE